VPADFWLRLVKQYQSQLTEAALAKLANTLGLSTTSLRLLSVGWSAKHKAWTFPMRDARLQLWALDYAARMGLSYASKGSKEGLFIPDTTFANSQRSELAFAKVQLTLPRCSIWFPELVIGRPSCLGGVKLIVELCRARRFSEIVIFADNDLPGQRGAQKLARELSLYVPNCELLPRLSKDMRDWKKHGANRADVERAIAEAAIISLAIRAG
jgi:hypothetical protein